MVAAREIWLGFLKEGYGCEKGYSCKGGHGCRGKVVIKRGYSGKIIG
jgi:hypothetical protein